MDSRQRAGTPSESWIPVTPGSDFPLANMPYGVVRRDGELRAVVRVGNHVVDLTLLQVQGLLDDPRLPRAVFETGTLNAFLRCGRDVWSAVRRRLLELLAAGARETLEAFPDEAVVEIDEVHAVLPIEVGDYVDFYSSREHATNLGRLFRPGSEPLNPNWSYLPVGYHGRAGTVVVSGTDVLRPCGQVVDRDPPPSFAPTRRLDFELEVAFVTGDANALGQRVPVSEARDHIFGMVLVNDWSARDVQKWEYVPLGPFLGKSFATTISPWIVTLEALEPFRVEGPSQDPEPLEYLRLPDSSSYDIDLTVDITPAGGASVTITRTNFRGVYWTIAQQLAHASANGALVRAGDLFASGTISGSEPGSYGSLVETTWGGTNPVPVGDGAERAFLEDGDTVAMRGRCEAAGATSIGFGEVTGTILPAAGDS